MKMPKSKWSLSYFDNYDFDSHAVGRVKKKYEKDYLKNAKLIAKFDYKLIKHMFKQAKFENDVQIKIYQNTKYKEMQIMYCDRWIVCGMKVNKNDR
jgi:hypothetical protein